MRELEMWDDRSERPHYDFPNVGGELQVSSRSVSIEAARNARPIVPISCSQELLQAFPNSTVPSHWHDDVEFVAIRRGKMIYNVNGQTVPMQRGEGIFVNSRQLHFAIPMDKDINDCNYICIRIHPSLLCVSDIFKQNFILPVIDRGIAFTLLLPSIKWQKDSLDLVLSMFEIRESQKECGTAAIKALSAAASLWSLLFENLPRDNSNAKVKDSDLMSMRNMVGFIQQNYSSTITLLDIASAGAVGQSKCCSLFAEYFKQSPVSYLNRHRLSKGAQLLRGTDRSITEIAQAVGFGGSSYFAESFKKWAGVSPTKFRKTSSDAINDK